MAISDKWIEKGVMDIEVYQEPDHRINFQFPREEEGTSILNARSIGKYATRYFTDSEHQLELIDNSWAYCAADSGFVQSQLTLHIGTDTSSSPTQDVGRVITYKNTENMPVGLSRHAEYSAYGRMGLNGSRNSSTIKRAIEGTPFNDYLNVYNNNADGAGKVYGKNIVPAVKFDIKNIIALPVIEAYKLKNGGNPATEDVKNFDSSSEIEIGYYTLEGYNKAGYKDFPYIKALHVAYITIRPDTENKRIAYGNANGQLLPMVASKLKANLHVYEDNGYTEKEITYYPTYGDDHNYNIVSTLKDWNGSAIVDASISSFNHLYCLGGPAKVGVSVVAQSLYSYFGSSGAVSYNSEWFKSRVMKNSSNSNRDWVIYYSDAITDSNIEAFTEYCMKQVAYLGLFFRRDLQLDTMDYRFIDDGTYMGIIDDGGITHGEYTQGFENTKNKQFDWDDPLNNTPYNPGGGGSDGPTSGGDKDREKSTYSGSGFDIYNKSYSALGLRRYIITEAQFENLYNYLDQCLNYDASIDRFASNFKTKVPGASTDDILKIWHDRFPTEADYLAHVTNKLGYGNDPRSNIVSVMLYPCEVTEGTERKIRLGQYIEGHIFEANVPVGSGTTEWIQFAPNANYAADDVHEPSFDIDTLYGSAITVKHPNGWDDFRAYEPYSRCELYIPYHGIIPINLADCLNKSLTINIQFDTITGSSVAVIRVNDQIYSTIPGQIGFNMPFSVDASSMTATGLMGLSAQSQANKLQATGNVVGGVLGAVGGVMSGNYLGAAGAVTNAIIGSKQNQIQEKAIEYSINHACDGRLVSNAASAIANMGLEKKAKLIWHYPLMLAYNDKNYAHTVGYATTRSGSVGSFSGYTVFTNVDLSAVSATEQEKAMILAQLQNGIII